MVSFYCHTIFGKPCFTDEEGTGNMKTKQSKTKQEGCFNCYLPSSPISIL